MHLVTMGFTPCNDLLLRMPENCSLKKRKSETKTGKRKGKEKNAIFITGQGRRGQGEKNCRNNKKREIV